MHHRDAPCIMQEEIQEFQEKDGKEKSRNKPFVPAVADKSEGAGLETGA